MEIQLKKSVLFNSECCEIFKSTYFDRPDLDGVIHMSVGKKIKNPTRKTRSRNFAILQVAENKNSDVGFVNTKILC